jgi:hypothetical protein
MKRRLGVASSYPSSPAARVSTALRKQERACQKVKIGKAAPGSTGWLKVTQEKKMSYPQGSELSQDRWGGENFASVLWTSGVEPTSRGAAMAEAVVPFAPKSNSKSDANDQLDRAGQAILGALHRAAGVAEANYQQAVEMTHKLSAQLRAAEDRMRQLEATVRHHEGRADRAEKWLYQISMEIEQKFFGSGNNRPSQNQR